MPRLNDVTMENNPTAGHFGFSAVRLDKLGASEYTLATITVDCSGSVTPFIGDIEKALKECVKALQFSPRANNLMLRVVKFSSSQEEVHGFKLLADCNIDDYTNCLQAGGTTVLYDASIGSIEAIKNYSSQVYNQKDIETNGIAIVLTDGCDYGSSFGVDSVGAAKDACVKEEALESILTILVGVNIKEPTVSKKLDQLKVGGKFDQFVELDNADSKTIARLGNFISKSISSQSQSLGTGGPSQTINFGALTI